MQSLASNTVIRDNIRDNRLIRVSEKVSALIDTPEFQRLRRIKQMGLSSFVFPSAEHSRFAHSLGVYATASEVFAALRLKAEACAIQFWGIRFDDDAEKAFCIAAMCHDLGHTAFSHVLEGVLLPQGLRRHEACTLAIINSDREIRNVLEDAADIDAITLFLEKEHPNKALSSLVTGPFDVDRCDYLLRDSQMCGVDYGQYDFKWLLHSISIDVNKYEQPILLLDGPRGLDGLGQFLAARRYMHRQVYYHPTIRAAQLLLKGIFTRIQDTDHPATLVKLVPAGLRPILRRDLLTLEDFLATTDVEVLYMLRILQEHSKDAVVKILCQMFNSRRFPKCFLDSAKLHASLGATYGIDLAEVDTGAEGDGADTKREPEPEQLALWIEKNPMKLADFEEKCRDVIATRFKLSGKPADLSRYLVSSDRANFKSDPPTDFMFSFPGKNVPLELIDHDVAGHNVPKLTESFQIYRMFGPPEYRDSLMQLVTQEFPN